MSTYPHLTRISMSTPTKALSRYRLLVVDGEGAILSLMKEFLTRLGFEVDCASRKEDAVELLKTSEYSLALLDLGIAQENNLDGLELADDIHRYCPWMRIVLLVSYAPPGIKEVARSYGATVILQKPLHLSVLESTIYQVLT
jgi:CheY-like chemotaxis protein